MIDVLKPSYGESTAGVRANWIIVNFLLAFVLGLCPPLDNTPTIEIPCATVLSAEELAQISAQIRALQNDVRPPRRDFLNGVVDDYCLVHK